MIQVVAAKNCLALDCVGELSAQSISSRQDPELFDGHTCERAYFLLSKQLVFVLDPYPHARLPRGSGSNRHAIRRGSQYGLAAPGQLATEASNAFDWAS